MVMKFFEANVAMAVGGSGGGWRVGLLSGHLFEEKIECVASL